MSFQRWDILLALGMSIFLPPAVPGDEEKDWKNPTWSKSKLQLGMINALTKFSVCRWPLLGLSTCVQLNPSDLDQVLHSLEPVEKGASGRMWCSKRGVQPVMPTFCKVCGSWTCVIKMIPQRNWKRSLHPSLLKILAEELHLRHNVRISWVRRCFQDVPCCWDVFVIQIEISMSWNFGSGNWMILLWFFSSKYLWFVCNKWQF